MSRCSHLVVALSLVWAGAALAAEPTARGDATGSTTGAARDGTPAIALETWLVGGAAVIGTAVGLASGGGGDGEDGFTAPSTSTSTATSTVN